MDNSTLALRVWCVAGQPGAPHSHVMRMCGLWHPCSSCVVCGWSIRSTALSRNENVWIKALSRDMVVMCIKLARCTPHSTPPVVCFVWLALRGKCSSSTRTTITAMRSVLCVLALGCLGYLLSVHRGGVF